MTKQEIFQLYCKISNNNEDCYFERFYHNRHLLSLLEDEFRHLLPFNLSDFRFNFKSCSISYADFSAEYESSQFKLRVIFHYDFEKGVYTQFLLQPKKYSEIDKQAFGKRKNGWGTMPTISGKMIKTPKQFTALIAKMRGQYTCPPEWLTFNTDYGTETKQYCQNDTIGYVEDIKLCLEGYVTDGQEVFPKSFFYEFN